MREHIITIGDDGSLNFIADDSLSCLTESGKTTVERASHVLPVNRVLRVVFRWLRDHFGEKGWIAAFTRQWPCIWQADLAPSNGPILRPFNNRQDAINAEIQWIERNRL